MGQAQVHLDDTSLDLSCSGQRYWYVFFVSSLLTFFGGIFIIFCWRFLTLVCNGNNWQACKKSVSHIYFYFWCYFSIKLIVYSRWNKRSYSDRQMWTLLMSPKLPGLLRPKTFVANSSAVRLLFIIGCNIQHT